MGSQGESLSERDFLTQFWTNVLLVMVRPPRVELKKMAPPDPLDPGRVVLSPWPAELLTKMQLKMVADWIPASTMEKVGVGGQVHRGE